MDLSKNDVTQKPREGQIRRDEVQWTAMSISFKRQAAQTRRRAKEIKIEIQCREESGEADGSSSATL